MKNKKRRIKYLLKKYLEEDLRFNLSKDEVNFKINLVSNKIIGRFERFK